jgi:ParB family chromosome partitioning protein
MKVIDVPIAKIHVGERHREDMGDIEALAANIREMGLLQPIGIDEYFNLVYGARRLEACEDLGWNEIPCVVVQLQSLIAGEYAENEFRKAFTKMEREAIGRAIEADLLAKDRKPGPKSSANADDPVARSIDIAAKKAGFTSTESFERAKTIAAKGVPELKAAVNTEDR